MAKRSAYWLAALAAWILLAAPPADAADLTLKRVVLSTGGVGYFEYEAAVEGDATLTLEVPLDQVDDVLKSLVVYDAGGSAGEITLPGREPLTQSFIDLPFDRAALNSETDLLNALQGAEIRIAAPKAISGRLVHVDEETVRGADGVARHRSRVSVMTDAGLQQFVLQDVDAIAFADPALQRQVNTALSRIAAYRAGGRRQLTLTLHGTGPRTVRVGYVVAMPLWKASYRLSLPPDPKAATARLQGWAVLENFSGRAWQDVELTLTLRQSGDVSPGALRELLRAAPDGAGRVGRACPAAPRHRHRRRRGRRQGKPGAATRHSRLQRAPAGAAMAMAVPAPPASPPPPAPIEAAAASEDATQIAFTPPYKVSVAAGQSLVLPLLDRELPARRIDLYQPAVDPRHPLAAIELTNKSDDRPAAWRADALSAECRAGRALSRRRAARRAAGRRQAPLELCGRRQGDDRPQQQRAPAGRQGDDRRRRDAGEPGDPLDDDAIG